MIFIKIPEDFIKEILIFVKNILIIFILLCMFDLVISYVFKLKFPNGSEIIYLLLTKKLVRGCILIFHILKGASIRINEDAVFTLSFLAYTGMIYSLAKFSPLFIKPEVCKFCLFKFNRDIEVTDNQIRQLAFNLFNFILLPSFIFFYYYFLIINAIWIGFLDF